LQRAQSGALRKFNLEGIVGERVRIAKRLGDRRSKPIDII
jgi:hypothetical protein